MLFRMIFFSLLLAMCGGCRKETATDDAALAKFAGEVQLIRDSLIKEKNNYRYYKVVDRVNEAMAAISNVTVRSSAARSYAEMLAEVDLTALPYRQRVTSAIMFGGHAYFAFQVMLKNGVNCKDAMELFFACLAKYQDACTSIPTAAREKDENMDSFILRKDCARVLMDDYQRRMSILKRFWLPHLSDYVPAEYHEEFKRRADPLFKYPAKQQSQLQKPVSADARDARPDSNVRSW